MGWLRKSLLVLGLLCLVGGLGGAAIVFAMSDGFRGMTTMTDVEKTVAVESVQKIDIRSDFVRIHFVESPDDQAHFHLSGTMNDQQQRDTVMEIDVKDGTLTADIRVQQNRNEWFNFDVFEIVPLLNGERTSLRLEVALPKRQFEEIKLKTDAGDVVANQPLHADRIMMSTSFGDLSLSDFAGKSLELKTDAGDIEAYSIAASESVKLSTSFGDIAIGFSKIAGEVSLTSNAGDLEISLPKTDALRMDLKNDVGEIDVDVPNVQYRTRSNQEIQGEVGSGGPLLKARSNFGHIEVRTE